MVLRAERMACNMEGKIWSPFTRVTMLLPGIKAPLRSAPVSWRKLGEAADVIGWTSCRIFLPPSNRLVMAQELRSETAIAEIAPARSVRDVRRRQEEGRSF